MGGSSAADFHDNPTGRVVDFDGAPHEYRDIRAPAVTMDLEPDDDDRYSRARITAHALEVEQDHAYCVGRFGMLVHDAAPCAGAGAEVDGYAPP